MKFKIIFVLLSSLVLSLQLAAKPWFADKVYHSGDTVEFKGKSYLASYWNQGLQPVDNKFAWDGWISIKGKHLAEWKPHKRYKAGSVVQFNDENYIAKWWNKDIDPDSEGSLWVKLAIGVKYVSGSNA